MAPRKKDTNDVKKKEFGTGLRAQLEKRREEPEGAPALRPKRENRRGEPKAAPKAEALQPNVELRFELTARPADSEPITVVSSDGATDDLRKQLAAAQVREDELKAELAKQQEVFDAGLESEHGLSR